MMAARNSNTDTSGPSVAYLSCWLGDCLRHQRQNRRLVCPGGGGGTGLGVGVEAENGMLGLSVRDSTSGGPVDLVIVRGCRSATLLRAHLVATEIAPFIHGKRLAAVVTLRPHAQFTGD